MKAFSGQFLQRERERGGFEPLCNFPTLRTIGGCPIVAHPRHTSSCYRWDQTSAEKSSFKLLFFGEEASHLVVHLGKVCGKELKDEGEGGLGVDDVVQRHNVRVPQLLQQACLSRMGAMSSYLKSNRNKNNICNNNDQTRKRRQNTSLIAVNGVPSSS